MTSDRLYELMQKPEELSSETLPELRQLMEDFPYFHTVKLLYLKNMAMINDIRFASELKRLSIGIADRKKLFMFLEGSNYGLQIFGENKPEKPASDTFSLIDAFLSSKEADTEAATEASLIFQPSVSSDYIYWSLAEKGPEAEAANANQLQHHELIDTFISKDEKRETVFTISDGLLDSNRDKSFSKPSEENMSAGIDDSYFTETLARIYIKQRRYEKAMQIIQNLSLKYPEKNVYFADQIKFLEKLIINTKK